MDGNRKDHEAGRVKRNHHKNTRLSQAQDERGRATSTNQHRVWGRSDSEVRPHQGGMPFSTGATQNRGWRSSSQSRTEQSGPSKIGLSQHRVWRSSSQNRTQQEDSSQRCVWKNGSKDRTNQGSAPLGPQHKMWRSGSENRTQQRSAPAGPVHRDCGANQETSEVSEEGVKTEVLMKHLAQIYGGYVDVKKAAELVQVCKPEFFRELVAFVRSSAPDSAYLSDFATFCLSALTSLPSSMCVQFQDTLAISLQLVKKSGNAALWDRFARLQEKLEEHINKIRELDGRVAREDFRTVPLLPVKADAFLCPPDISTADEIPTTEQGYLSAMFFSIYEDFMGRVRDGIRSFRDAESAPIKLTSDMHFYRGVRFLNPELVGDRLCFATTAPLGRLRVGALVCFSHNGFQSLLFATVERANNRVVVRLCSEVHSDTRQLFDHEYAMADSGLLAEPILSVLRTLQQLQIVPLRRYLVEDATVPERKKCVQQEQPDLDSWQREAYSSALSQELCLVLGPPGSGKTHLGCVVARNTRSPVLVLCESHSGLDNFLRRLMPVGVYRLGDRTKHQQRTKLWCVRKTAMLMHLRKLELELALLARKDGVVALASLREGGVVSDAHFRSFLQQPDTASVFYCWLVDGAEPLHARPTPLVPFSSAISHTTEDPILAAVQPSLKWAERLENLEKKRCEVNTEKRRLQEQFGLGENVAQKMDVLMEVHRLLNIKLDKIRKRLTETWPSKRLTTCHDVWQLKPIERWGLYFAWVAALRAKLLDRFAQQQAQLVQENKNIEQIDQLIDLEMVQQSEVVGATTEEATRLRLVLEKLAPKTVIVDEATNITEAQLVTCLPQSCQQLVLLGEMRPIQDAGSHQKIHSAQSRSLVHRLVDKGMAVSELKLQHRMQPQVAKISLSALYPRQESHTSVAKMCEVRGVNQNMFFITHEQLAEKVGDTSDYQNLHEANFLLALCHYLMLQGYSAQDIAILTTYPSQRHYMRQECECSLLMKDVHISLVKEFCGQERRLVLLSTVHHEASSEYVSVMLTRAKMGLYIIGNLQQLAKSSTVWRAVQKTLEKHDAIGSQLLLRCQVHQDELTAVSSVADFPQISERASCFPVTTL